MNDATEPSDQRTSPQHGRRDNRPDAPDLLFRPPLPTDDGWEYYRRGPQLLASIGNWSWIRRASRERLARQYKGQDGEYIHHWWIKEQCSPKTPVIAEDAQALANTWGKELHRSGTWGAAMNLYLRTFPERDVPNLDNWPGARGHVK